MAVIKQVNISANEKQSTISTSLVNTKSDRLIKQRFSFVLSDDKKAPVAQKVILSIMFLLFLLSYLIIIQPASLPNMSDLETGVSITPQNSYILVLDDGSMKLYVDGEFFGDVSESELHDDLHSKLPIYERRN